MSETTKPPAIWGRRTAAFYAALQDQPVYIALTNGQILHGRLRGVDTYELMLQQEAGLELLINKGQVLYVHRAPTGGTA